MNNKNHEKNNLGQKIGFWTLLAIVINAQLGSSIFLLPTKLAAFGPLGLIGWLIGGIGAILIAMIFGFLCLETSKTGGPHIYATMTFGKKIGFFVSWLYWCGGWITNPILITTAIDYLEQIVGPINVFLRFFLEAFIVILFTLLNIRGIKWAGLLESIMVFIKLFPLILIPILAISNINFDNFSIDNYSKLPDLNLSTFGIIISSSIIAFWGFIGLEEGGSTADSVKNAKKTVPLAIILGTSIVALISLIITLSIFGIIPCYELKDIHAPLAVVLGKLIGGTYDKIIGLLTFLMCCGSLNAWVLFSGKLAQSASNEGLFPEIFGKTNKNGSAYISLIIAGFGTICVLAILEFTPYKNTFSDFLDMSVIMYIVLYLMAIISYLGFIFKNKKENYSIIRIIIAILAFLFCFTMLICSNLKDFIAVFTVLLFSLPIYFNIKNKLIDNNILNNK